MIGGKDEIMKKIPNKAGRLIFKNANFMTPHMLGYFDVGGETFAELSQGIGIDNEPIFGVTFRNTDGSQTHLMPRLHWSKAAAVDYMKSVDMLRDDNDDNSVK